MMAPKRGRPTSTEGAAIPILQSDVIRVVFDSTRRRKACAAMGST